MKQENKMSVLHVMHEIHASGAEMMLYNAYPFWKDEVEGTLLATGATEGAFADAMRERGYVIDHVPSGRVTETGAHVATKADKLRHLVRFYRYMKVHHYDVVHIHRESLSFEYALLAKLTGSTKICRTIHTTFPHTGVQRRIKSITRWLMRHALSVRFVAISDGVYENERRVFGNVCSNVIYNWCDNSKFCFHDAEEKRIEKEKLGLSDKLVLVTVGNCEPYKGHDLLVRAIAAMKHKDAIQYLHIGYAAGETEKEEALAKELHLSDEIRFLGRMDPKSYLLAADLYVMPSHYEGLSIAALEAIFTGMALLLAEVPGLIEFQDKNLDNIRYFKRTVEALAGALDEAAVSYKTGAFAPSRAQSDRATELYDCAGQVAKYVKLYRDMTNK